MSLPSKYKPEFCELVITLGRKGHSRTAIAALLRVDRSTLYDWMSANPEFADALEFSMTCSQAHWEDKALAAIDLHVSQFDARLWAKIMSARFPKEYRETGRKEVTVSLHPYARTREAITKPI